MGMRGRYALVMTLRGMTVRRVFRVFVFGTVGDEFNE